MKYILTGEYTSGIFLTVKQVITTWLAKRCETYNGPLITDLNLDNWYCSRECQEAHEEAEMERTIQNRKGGTK